MSFSHENLNVYRRTLAFYVSIGVYNENRAIAIRSADQRQSVSTAHESAGKLAERLDLCVVQGQVPKVETTLVKSFYRGYWR